MRQLYYNYKFYFYLFLFFWELIIIWGIFENPCWLEFFQHGKIVEIYSSGIYWRIWENGYAWIWEKMQSCDIEVMVETDRDKEMVEE